MPEALLAIFRFAGLVSPIFSFVRIAAGGLADDADQYGYGDDHDEYENEQ